MMEQLHLFIGIIFQNYLLIFAFFFIAILYASVGFGGGSSYLAVLSLTGFAFIQLRAISLLCNVVVVSGGTYIFAKNKLYNWKKVIPLVLLSIPMAFLGGFLSIKQQSFFIILALTLIIAAVLMLLSKRSKSKNETISTSTHIKNASLGGFIGFVSGMVGIGGGVFLAPLLHLTKWDSPKKIAAASSFFILVNSIAGLIGQVQNPNFNLEPNLTIVLLVTVFIGGQIGSRLSVNIISPQLLKKITAILIVFVGIKILYEQFYH
jgi:uncharacterized membrane protein YfcA